jgi:hypothetical protein
MFNYPLTASQIHRFLISNKPQPLSSIKQNIKHSLQQQLISTRQNFYTLPARVEIVSTIEKRQKFSHQKKNRAKDIAQRLSCIPSLQAVFLTGALAMDNAKSNDDIDVMLVTAPNQLWTTRLKVIRTLDQLGVRRKARMTLAKDLVCPNIYVTTDSLAIPAKAQNLYTAHEIAQVVSLVDKSSVYCQFLNQNRWIKKFLANFPIPNISSGYDKNHQIHPSTPKLTEKLFYFMQTLYMQRHRTTESVSMNRAFFHPRPTGSIILDEYHSRTKALGIES